MKNNNFRLWVPLDTIKKSKDAKGNIVMKLGGIASTTRRDMDGESLDPNGFDTTYLENTGIVNWNHNKSPEAVIGEPSIVEKRNGKLYVETTLYPDNPLAKSVYDLAEVLQKNSKTRRIGYSIEGKATLRDPLDKSIVKKARVNNIALTISPKNPDSKVDIIKGMLTDVGDESDTIEKSMDEMVSEVDTMLKSVKNQLHLEPEGNIVDIQRPDGVRISVDGAYNVKIEKSMDTETGGVGKLSREHVDKQQRKLEANAKENMECEEMDDVENEIQKSELVERILEINPVISFTNAFNISKNIIEMATTNKTKVTDDVINKALNDLGLDNLSKGAGKSSDDDEEDEVSKGDDEEMYGDGKDDDEEKEDDKKPAPKKESKKSAKSKDDEDEEEDDEEKVEKGIDDTKAAAKNTTTKNVSVGHLEKSIKQTDLRQRQSFKSVGTLMKGLYQQLQESNSLIKGLVENNKSMADEIGELKGELVKANDAIEDLSTPNQPKSVRKSVERKFEKGMDSNGEETGAADTSKKQLSITRNRPAVLHLLDTMTFEKGFNDQLAKAMTTFESSGNISKAVVDLIAKEKAIELVK